MSEHALQVATHQLIILYSRRHNWLAYHTANERRCTPQAGARLKLAGVKPGVPDWTILMPGGRVAFVELKASRGSLTPGQKEFRDWCRANETPWHLCRSVDEFRAILDKLVEGNA